MTKKLKSKFADVLPTSNLQALFYGAIELLEMNEHSQLVLLDILRHHIPFTDLNNFVKDQNEYIELDLLNSFQKHLCCTPRFKLTVDEIQNFLDLFEFLKTKKFSNEGPFEIIVQTFFALSKIKKGSGDIFHDSLRLEFKGENAKISDRLDVVLDIPYSELKKKTTFYLNNKPYTIKTLLSYKQDRGFRKALKVIDFSSKENQDQFNLDFLNVFDKPAEFSINKISKNCLIHNLNKAILDKFVPLISLYFSGKKVTPVFFNQKNGSAYIVKPDEKSLFKFFYNNPNIDINISNGEQNRACLQVNVK